MARVKSNFIKEKRVKTTKYLSITAASILLILTACSEQKTDDERILEEINSTSVHLALGLKIITTNPDNDPEITAAQEKVKEILKASENKGHSDGLSITELGRLAKIAYQAKKLGAAEVALGKQTDFRFLAQLLSSEKNTAGDKLTIEQDHALTLGFMYMLNLHPAIPLPISDKTLLYEAWMAGDTKLENSFLDDVLRAAQISAFASNDFCKFAAQKSENLRKNKMEKVNLENVKESFAALTGAGRAVAHAPEMLGFLAPIILAPTVIELTPGVIRVIAHSKTASCFERLKNTGEALKQYEYTLEVMENMGLPEPELALLKASISYKKKDFDTTREHLKNAAKSKLLDERSKQNLVTLANNLQSPDESLVAKYFGSANLALTMGQIIHNRLADEGVYDDILNNEQLKSLELLYSGFSSTDTDDLLDAGKGLFD